MAPLTAIIDKTTPGDKVIKLFYCTEKAQLGLALWSGTKDDDPTDPIQKPQAVGNDQFILNPSQMTSFNFQDIETVFALTTGNPFRVTTADLHTIATVSPSYEKKLDIFIGNITLASCASDEDAWVYYSVSAGTNTRRIMELNIQTSRSTPLTFSTDLWINSFAAAWYDTITKKRTVIYESSSLMEYCVDDDTYGKPINGTGDMQRNTPVAVTFNDGRVYLYYTVTGAVGVAGGIRRAIKSNDSWGSTAPIEGPVVARNSQLAVVRANGINHLFYVARDENQELGDYIVHHRDEIE